MSAILEMAPRCHGPHGTEEPCRAWLSRAMGVVTAPPDDPVLSKKGNQRQGAVEKGTECITVLIADDEERFRRVVFALLDPEPEIEVVGHASDGAEAVRIAQELVPDLVLLDVRMPGVSGIEAAEQICCLLPTTKIVMLTSSDEEDDVFEALKAGAGGYILKDRLTDLPDAVRVVARDLGLLLSPAIASKVLTEFRDGPRRPAGPGLTERELEVLRMVSRGYANQEIAEELTLSLHTVKRHVANIMAKLHQRSRLEAVLYAIRTGVLTPESHTG